MTRRVTPLPAEKAQRDVCCVTRAGQRVCSNTYLRTGSNAYRQI